MWQHRLPKCSPNPLLSELGVVEAWLDYPEELQFLRLVLTNYLWIIFFVILIFPFKATKRSTNAGSSHIQ